MLGFFRTGKEETRFTNMDEAEEQVKFKYIQSVTIVSNLSNQKPVTNPSNQ